MSETGVSCDVAGEEAERLLRSLVHAFEHETSYDKPSRAHIIEHLIGGLAGYAAELRGDTPRDILADVIGSAPSSEEWRDFVQEHEHEDDE